MPSDIILAATSDQHANSSVGLCPPEGAETTDGNRTMPSKAQLWLWDCWEDFWKDVGELKQKTKSKLYCLYNGDAIEGAAGSVQARRTTQLMHLEDDVQRYIRDRVFSVPKALNPSKQWMIRGTESHVGKDEESLAKKLGCEPDADTNNRSRYHARIRIKGTLIDAQHHGSMGRLPRTEQALMKYRAFDILDEHAGLGLEIPNLVIRSHLHRFVDSGPDSRPMVPRVIQTPSWQLKTSYVHAKFPNAVPHIGGVIIIFRDNMAPQVIPKLYWPSLPTVEEV